MNFPKGSTSRVRLARSATDISQELEAIVDNSGAFTTNGAFTFPSVGPGSYDVFIDPLPDKTYISSIAYRGRENLNSPVRVDSSPGANTLNIYLARSDAVAEGVVVDRSLKPVPGAQVVLVPRAPRPRADRYMTVSADAGGNFQMTGIPGDAGNYLILAFEELEPGAHYAFSYDSSLLMRYAPSGQTLDPLSSSTSLRLFAIPATETAGGLR